MSETGIIPHHDERLTQIRESYLLMCEGNYCAAAILNVFEYWTNVKLKNAEQAEIENAIARHEGQQPDQNTSLWIYKTYEGIQEDLLGLFGRNKIISACKYLQEREYLYTRTNPRFKWDKTTQYLLNIHKILTEINDGEFRNKLSIVSKRTVKAHGNKRAIPEDTSEDTSETTTTERLLLSEVHKAYENNIGLLTAMIVQDITDLCKDYSSQWVLDAIKEAVTREKRSLAYVKGCLKNWKRDGRQSTSATTKPATTNGAAYKPAEPLPDVRQTEAEAAAVAARLKAARKELAT